MPATSAMRRGPVSKLPVMPDVLGYIGERNTCATSTISWAHVPTCAGDYETDDDRGGRDSEREGEDGDARGDGRVVFRHLKVEGHIIEERPDD